jgi:hypothetical protein
MASGLEAAGHDVRIVDTTPIAKPTPLSLPWWSRKLPGGGLPDPGDRLLSTARELARDWRPDVLFCFKTVRLDQQRLLDLPVPLKVHYSPDDVSNSENVTADYLAHEQHWSLVVTTKRHNVEEIAARSGTKPLFVWSAFDPAWHHPRPLQRPYTEYVAGFIGNARPDRLALVTRLSRRLGRDFLLAGERWSRMSPTLARHASVRGPRYGESFSSAVRAVRCNLVLLNAANRDSHTCRSFEVPAAGGLVLAERTADHQLLFDEGREALMFSSEDELLDLVACTGREPDRFAEIRRRGHERIVGGNHSYRYRAAEILDALTA